jgi:hypothetical protein
MKKALDPIVKRASQNAVQQVKNNIKKQNQAKKNMPTKKETEVRYVKASPFEGLKEIVEMKKQKAVANELDSLIFEQEKLKKIRNSNGSMTENKNKPRVATPMETFIAANPDKLKDMTIEEVAKLSMFTNSGGSGGSDPLSMLMAMNMNKGNNGGENDLQTKLLGMLMEKMIKGNGDANKSGGDMEMVKLMMQQNMQTQNMLMSMVMKKDEAPKQDPNNLFMKELFSMVKGQTDFENTFLRDKIQNLEMRQNSNDPLGEAKRMMDYIKTFKGFFGGGNTSPEAMNHEIKLKELTYEQARQATEDARRTANMAQIGEMINNTISTFGQILGEPIAEAAKSKIEAFTEQAKNPPPENIEKIRISPELLKKEIDLGDLSNLENLENLETDLEQFENRQEQVKGRSPRFKVYETAE